MKTVTRRVLVFGGRDYHDRDRMEHVLRASLDDGDIVVHGAAPGTDSLAGEIAERLGHVVEPHPADWTGPCRPTCKPGHRRPPLRGSDYNCSICPAAGVYRNQEMIDSGIDYAIGFPGGRGTADMLSRVVGTGIAYEMEAPL